MSLKPTSTLAVPTMTAEVARAAFPQGNPYLCLRDELGLIFNDTDFADLFPTRGQPGLPPWRLALVTVLQFRENLSARQAADAVRARIDWKYLLGLELTDAGFDFSVLSEFRTRLVEAEASDRLLNPLLQVCQVQGLLQARGRQRTDATHVLTAVRALNRLELVAKTLRATLNVIATLEPVWLKGHVPDEWYKRYGRRIEYRRRPSSEAERQEKAQQIGEDGTLLLDWLAMPETPAALKELPEVDILKAVWQRHYQRHQTNDDNPDKENLCWRVNQELAKDQDTIKTPYDVEARYRNKNGLTWLGYNVHLSETCDAETPHLVTQVMTTPANVGDAKCTAAIQQALVDQAIPPAIHLADASYIAGDLLVKSQSQHKITLVGPVRDSARWQHHVEGAYALDQFTFDWDNQTAYCPQGQASTLWYPFDKDNGYAYIRVVFDKKDCSPCAERARCTRAKDTSRPRSLQLQPQPQQEAIHRMRTYLNSDEGKQLYNQRAGIEGTLAQGIRRCGLRQSRYVGLAKTHLQQVATAAAINLDRLVNWFEHRPRAKTRVSRFAALAA